MNSVRIDTFDQRCLQQHGSTAIRLLLRVFIQSHETPHVGLRRRDNLRWFETVFHFPLQLNFMKGLLVCSKRLLLLVDSRCCNNL